MFHRPLDGTVLEVLPHMTGVLEAVCGIVGDYLEGINFLGQKDQIQNILIISCALVHTKLRVKPVLCSAGVRWCSNTGM